MQIVGITNDNFEEEVLKCSVPVILDFWAEWCAPCKAQALILEDMADKLGDTAKIGKINVDEQAALALKYQIMNIPTIVIMKDGIFRERVSGLHSGEELMQLVTKIQEEGETRISLDV